MIHIQLTCNTCGKQSELHELRHFSGNKKPPFYDLERDLKVIVSESGWVYQHDACGDIYCSYECSQ